VIGGHVVDHPRGTTAHGFGKVFDQHLLNFRSIEDSSVRLVNFVFHGVDVSPGIASDERRQESHVRV